MTTLNYQQLIINGIKDLPNETLLEIVDFIYFVRKRTLQPEIFEEEIQSILLNAELQQLSHNETVHLEEEFKDYDKLYPKK